MSKRIRFNLFCMDVIYIPLHNGAYPPIMQWIWIKVHVFPSKKSLPRIGVKWTASNVWFSLNRPLAFFLFFLNCKKFLFHISSKFHLFSHLNWNKYCNYQHTVRVIDIKSFDKVFSNRISLIFHLGKCHFQTWDEKKNLAQIVYLFFSFLYGKFRIRLNIIKSLEQ